MEQFGYIDLLDLLKHPSTLKRSLLMFDSIIVPSLYRTSMEIGETYEEFRIQPKLTQSEYWADSGSFFENSNRVIKDLFWLKEEGMVGEMFIGGKSLPPHDRISSPAIQIRWNSKEDIIDYDTNDTQEIYLPNYDKNHNISELEVFNSNLRKLLQICRFNGLNVYPVFNNSLPLIDKKVAHKEEVLFVLLKNIPTPSEDTSYEQIKDFFQDPDSKEKMVRLKDWVNELTSMKSSFIELQEKIDFLINEYRSHMALHKIKNQAGAFETVVQGTAEMMEAAVSGKFSKIVSPLFAAKHQQIAMLESEMNAPGRKLAYIIKTQDEFGK